MGDELHFNRGIAYLLIQDNKLAQKHIDLYFGDEYHPKLKAGYDQLVAGELEKATGSFSGYLELDHRSTVAVVGIALSTAKREYTNTIELLKRAIGLKAGFSTAYLSLGVEYWKKKNYPMAESYFKRALSWSNIPEYKILLSYFYIDTGSPARTLGLMKREADRTPDNFYYNFLTAKALLALNKLEESGTYIQNALDVRPADSETKLLMAKYHLGNNDAKKAKQLLKTLKFKDYNADYVKTYAHALLKLNDKKAVSYLEQFFENDKWDKDVNCFLGLHEFNKKKKKGNIQNWIYRTLIAGGDIEHLKELFPGEYKFPEYKALPFFDVTWIEWLDENLVLVAAVKKSGASEQIHIIDSEKMRVVKTLGYSGPIQNLVLSKDRRNIIFSTVAKENESVNIYAVTVSRNRFALRRVLTLDMPSVLCGFNSAGTLAYITDSKLKSVAFESPFKITVSVDEKISVYPVYPFPIYKYDVRTGRSMKLQNPEPGTIPIKAVKQYALVSDAFYNQSKVEKLIKKAEGFDITADEIVRVYFSYDLSSFIIYLSDSESAFQAVFCDYINGKVFPVDETMFLGKGNYAELKLLDFNPEKNELLFITKDEKEELLLYNYRLKMTTFLGGGTSEVYFDRKNRVVYALAEKSEKGRKTRPQFRVITLKPFLNRTLPAGRNISGIIPSSGETPVQFATNDGEILKLDEMGELVYVKPSMEGCTHAFSPSGEKNAAFVGGRLVAIVPFTEEKEKEK